MNDEFMKAVEADEDYILKWPCSGEDFNYNIESPYGELVKTVSIQGHTVYYKRIRAKKLFTQLVENNWNYAEPGILYWDQIDHWNMMDKNLDFHYAGVNPCAEEPLVKGGACLLGSMNIAAYIEDRVFLYDEFQKDVKTATKFLNEILDEGENLHPLQIQKEMAQYKPAIRDAVITNLSSKTSSELASAAGKELAKEQISNDINSILGGEREVLRVSFGQFIIQ